MKFPDIYRSEHPLKDLCDRLEIIPSKGEIYWKHSNSKKVKPGDVAGCKTKRGYIKIGRYSAHQIIYYHFYKILPETVDHINGNKSDNRIKNLRGSSQKQNSRNSILRKNNTSGFKGVHYEKQTKKYSSSITVNGKNIKLGRFKNKIEAALKYDEAAIKYFGKFAKTNKMLGVL